MTPFLLCTFGITWGVAAFLFGFPAAFESLFGAMSTSNPMFIAAVAAPSFSAMVVALAGSGWPGLRVLATIPWFLAGGILLSFVASWLFIRTGGSVVPSILLHYSVNFSLTMLGLRIPTLAIVLAICAVLILVLDRSVGWFRSPAAGLAGPAGPPRLDKWRRGRL